MIIVTSKNKMNQEACYRLVSNYEEEHIFEHIDNLMLSTLSDTRCFIIELNEGLPLQAQIESKELAEKLVSNGLSEKVQDIYLITHEVPKYSNLPTFAHILSKQMLRLLNRRINIHIFASLNFKMTILVLLDHNQWAIYGLNPVDLPNNAEDFSIDMLSNIKNKHLLWQGEDLLLWMNHPQQTYTGTAYTWNTTPAS